MDEFYYMNYWHPQYGYQDLSNEYQNDLRNNQQKNSSSTTFYDPQEGFVKGNLKRDEYDAYKGYVPTVPVIYSEREKDLLNVQKYAFAVNDLNLYLNTHPSDGKAMELFNNYRNEYLNALRNYENKHGPLGLYATKMDVYWPWNKSPWPWEGGK